MAGAKRYKGDGKGRLGGRQKGTPNKVTGAMREMLAKFCAETYDDFVTSYKLIDSPRDKCKIYLEAQAYVTPKLSSVSIKESAAGKSFADELDELDALDKG